MYFAWVFIILRDFVSILYGFLKILGGSFEDSGRLLKFAPKILEPGQGPPAFTP